MFSWLKSRRTAIEQQLAGANSGPDATVAPTPAAPGPTDPLDALEAALEDGDLGRAADLGSKLPPALRTSARYLRLEGWLNYALGNLDGARKWLGQSIASDPGQAHAHALLAAVHMRQGRQDEALRCALAAEEHGGAYAWLRSMLGVLHNERGDSGSARSWFEKALALDPERQDALQALALITYRDHAWNELRDVSRRLVAADRSSPKFWSYLGTAEARAGTDEEAERAFATAVSLPGASTDEERDYAAFLINSGRIDEARDRLSAALERDAGQPLLHVAHAQCALILDGQSPDAWREYEWRLGSDPAGPQVPGRWHGETLATGTLRLVGEQGMGDLLLAARYLPEVLRRCARVRAEVPAPLVPLFRATAQRSGWTTLDVVAAGSPVAGDVGDRQLPFMSLMHVLGTQAEPLPSPYLRPEDERERAWGERLGVRTRRLRVALVWAGNPKREDDILRSIPPAALTPLAALDDVEFVSLQTDGRPMYFRDLPLPLVDVTRDIRDFADSAAILRQCDLLVSIDTAAAHLAGACGVPCWTLLSRLRDWRWEMGGVDQPWYATTHRSFRVARNREWLPLIQRVAAELRAHAPRS